MIAKSHSGNFIHGQSVYNITVSNTGLSATSGTVTVTDTLRTGLTASQMAGSSLELHPARRFLHAQRPGRVIPR